MLLRGCPLWILALSMRPKELFTINFGAWDPFSTRAPMNIKLRDPSHKPKLSLILLRAWVGRKNDNGHLISFYIFGQLPGLAYSPLADRPTGWAAQQATVISQQKMAGKGAMEWFCCGVDSFLNWAWIFFRHDWVAKMIMAMFLTFLMPFLNE